MNIDPNKINVILATDCGSTTSKARFFKKIDGEYRYVTSGEAPTTVEAPYEDVTLGVRNAVREVEELTGHKLLSPEGIISPSRGENEGVDLYVTTSSAGGGLQMQVAGIIRTMTAESAERAALGAGAIVMDVLAIDDGREPWEKIERMRFLRPDMILLAGGVDGGSISHIVELAEFISAASPQHRLGAGFEVPLVFAGNKYARPHVEKLLDEDYALQVVDNIRPTLELENPEPARNAVHQLFMEHVMSHAPGYTNLMKWTPVPIMPTPAGEGAMFRTFAQAHNANLLGVGLGGATTNVYSYYNRKFVRSVSANLGMSYSICNVMKEAGLENILRWIPFEIEAVEVCDRLRNKMIRPTTIPHTLKQLVIEHAVAREALRLGLEHHKLIARPLLGARRDQSIEERLGGQIRTESYIDMNRMEWVGGTGGLLSHAPRRVQSMLSLVDGFGVEGVTKLFQDSVFMIPHLGVLSSVHFEAALQIFEKDCRVMLGTCVAFSGKLTEKDYGKEIGTLSIKMPDGRVLKKQIEYGTIQKIELGEGKTAVIEGSVASPFSLTTTDGSNRRFTATVEGGVVGVLIDARGRSIDLPADDEARRMKLREWFSGLEAYPPEVLTDQLEEI
jgi:uncharacterized protein (TIGR01319 family)